MIIEGMLARSGIETEVLRHFSNRKQDRRNRKWDI
jgi:hypothetical protein